MDKRELILERRISRLEKMLKTEEFRSDLERHLTAKYDDLINLEDDFTEIMSQADNSVSKHIKKALVLIDKAEDHLLDALDYVQNQD